MARSLPESVRVPVLAHWDTTTAAAVAAWTAELAPTTAALAKQHIEAAAADAARTTAQLAGLLPGDRQGGNRPGSLSPADALLYGPDDPEHPDAQQGLQAGLAALAAHPRIDRVKAALREQQDWEGVQLLGDLQHQTNDHR